MNKPVYIDLYLCKNNIQANFGYEMKKHKVRGVPN